MSITKETQNFDSIDFSQLDEETETDGLPQGQNNIDMDIVQPHLSLPPPPSATSRRNQRERGVVLVNEDTKIPSGVTEEQDSGQMPDGDVNFSKKISKGNGELTRDNNSNHLTEIQNGLTPGTSAVAVDGDSDDSGGRLGSNNQTTTPEAASSNPVQICYSTTTGNISVREGRVSTVGQDGTRYISTQEIAEQWDPDERKPLRRKRIRWIKIFSIISCFLFFPTGIPAAYFAFRVEKEFEEGILRGNIDRAQRFATRSERLCILSAILCILVGALVVTLIERPRFQSEHYHRGTVTG